LLSAFLSQSVTAVVAFAVFPHFRGVVSASNVGYEADVVDAIEISLTLCND
jgi:hypothetical protein